jgi:hypothetical protein
VTVVIDRLAWMQLTDPAGIVQQLQEALATAAAREGEVRASLEAVVSSTSWRLTWPVRAVVGVLRQRGRERRT